MPLALVTGASSGIGLAIAELLAERKFDLVVSARNRAALEEIANRLKSQHRVNVIVLPCDLGVPGAGRALAGMLREQRLEPDVLVNNAGFGTYGPFLEQTVESQVEMIQVNISSLVELTRLLTPGMVARRSGRVLNVASTAAFQAGPLMAVYYASKAFVVSFSEAIGNELSGMGVTVTALCPGPTTTAFQDRARMQESRLAKAATLMDAPTVARIGIDAMMAGKPLAIAGMLNRLVAWSTRLAPRQLTTKLARQVNAKA
jgi:short-subunit dehydrogenase